MNTALIHDSGHDDLQMVSPNGTKGSKPNTSHTNSSSGLTPTIISSPSSTLRESRHDLHSHSSSRDFLFPVGIGGLGYNAAFSTSYDAFFTDMVPTAADEEEMEGHGHGPVEFEDSRLYEGRFEDRDHFGNEYDHHHHQHQHKQHPRSPKTELIISDECRQQHERRSRQSTAQRLQLLELTYRQEEEHTIAASQPDASSLPLESEDVMDVDDGVECHRGPRDDIEKEEEEEEEEQEDDKMGHEDISHKRRKTTGRQWRHAQDVCDDNNMEGLENKSEDQGEDQVEVKEDEEGEAESEELAEEQARAACRKNKRRKKSAAAAANVAHLHAGSITTRKRGLKASLPSGQETSSLWSLPAPERQRHQQRQHHPQQPQQHCPTESDSRQHQLSSSSTSVSLTASTAAVSSTHCSNFITEQQFLMLAEDYLMSLSPKKREKALLSNSMYQKILMVLIQPKNTQVSTAQFRFWAKKMFTLSTTPTHHVVCHGGKPVATKECLYDVLVYCHRKSSHGGRDKTSAEVRLHYSWVPKELIARFVKHCPLCLSRRSTQQRPPGAGVGVYTDSSSSNLGDDMSPEVDMSSPSVDEEGPLDVPAQFSSQHELHLSYQHQSQNCHETLDLNHFNYQQQHLAQWRRAEDAAREGFESDRDISDDHRLNLVGNSTSNVLPADEYAHDDDDQDEEAEGDSSGDDDQDDCDIGSEHSPSNHYHHPGDLLPLHHYHQDHSLTQTRNFSIDVVGNSPQLDMPSYSHNINIQHHPLRLPYHPRQHHSFPQHPSHSLSRSSGTAYYHGHLSHHHHPHHPHHHQQNTASASPAEPMMPVTVHPNGHILHARHPIHNRARIMNLAAAGPNHPSHSGTYPATSVLSMERIQGLQNPSFLMSPFQMAANQQHQHHPYDSASCALPTRLIHHDEHLVDIQGDNNERSRDEEEREDVEDEEQNHGTESLDSAIMVGA